MSSLIVVAETRSEDIAYKLLLNGGVVMTDLSGTPAMEMGKLNSLVIEGGPNTLEVLAGAPANRPKPGPAASLNVRVLQAGYQTLAENAQRLVNFTLSPAAAAGLGPDLSPVHAQDIATQQSYGRWSWQDATPYSEADRATIESLVAAIHAAFGVRDYDAIATLCAARDAETARALDVPLAQLTGYMRQGIEGWFSDPTFTMRPLDPTLLSLDARAGGRLVEIADPQGLPFLKAEVQGKEVPLPMTVSHLDTGWAVVR